MREYGNIRRYIRRSRGLSIIVRIIGFVFGKDQPDLEKRSAYECGFNPYQGTRIPFDIRYYLFGIIFILFDLEACRRFPWAISISEIISTGYFMMMDFMLELVLGLVYAWRKGGLDWD